MPSPTAAHERPTAPVALITPGGAPPAWVPDPGTVPAMRMIDAAAGEEALRDGLGGAGAVLIDAAVAAPLSLARRAHRLAASAQLVIVAAPEEHQDLNRSMLFTPGIGEVWMVPPADVTTELIERAAAVGAQRQRHAERSSRVSERMAAIEPVREGRRFMADQYLAVLLELLPEPVLALDTDDTLIFRNPSAANVLRLDADEHIDGAELRTRLAPEDSEQLDVLLEQGRSTVARAELTLGEPPDARIYDASVAPVSGERSVRALVLHDVTEQVQTREQLEEQALELEEQKQTLQLQNEELQAQAEELASQADELATQSERNRRLAAERARVIEQRDHALEELRDAMRHRSRFYASMSHELRTPINAIIGYNDLLRGDIYGELPEEQRTPLDRIDRSAQHLLELINDVLDLSKLEAGKVVVQAAPVDVQQLIDDLEATMGPLAESNGVELRFRIRDECVDEFMTDPRRLRQILMNLLSNAIRYGGANPVDVRCTVSDNALRIEIEDRGPGIPPDQLDEIFEEFVQVASVDEGGTGLGLPIARTLARLLGGDLEVSSEVGVGSTFAVEVPPLEQGGGDGAGGGDGSGDGSGVGSPDDPEGGSADSGDGG